MKKLRRNKRAQTATAPACWSCGRTVNCDECAERRRAIDAYADQAPVTYAAPVARKAPEPPSGLCWQG